MSDIAIVSYAVLPPSPRYADRGEVELVAPVIDEALDAVGLTRRDIGFACSGSSDYLVGRPFSFVTAVDALCPWPPMRESHVEMDGAWALYEAFIRLQHGDIDTALVYSFGKASAGDLPEVLVHQLDPYYLAPLAPDSVSLAALQAQACVDAGVWDHALRPEDCAPDVDGAAVMVLARGDRAAALAERPAWIRGIDHRIEPHSLGARELARSVSTEQAAERVGVADAQAAELHAPFAHQEAILRRALKLSDAVPINSGGRDNAPMVAGLSRIGQAARHIFEGTHDRVLAHATSGPCLQQNLVAMLEAR